MNYELNKCITVKIGFNCIHQTFQALLYAQTEAASRITFDNPAIKAYLRQNFFMTSELISKFIENEQLPNKPVKIEFKKRNAVTGMFVKVNDYDELKSKNFWRIVSETNLEQWNKSRDINLVRIFNGTEFTKLSVIKKK
jgi:hypothetical protein